MAGNSSSRRPNRRTSASPPPTLYFLSQNCLLFSPLPLVLLPLSQISSLLWVLLRLYLQYLLVLLFLQHWWTCLRHYVPPLLLSEQISIIPSGEATAPECSLPAIGPPVSNSPGRDIDSTMLEASVSNPLDTLDPISFPPLTLPVHLPRSTHTPPLVHPPPSNTQPNTSSQQPNASASPLPANWAKNLKESTDKSLKKLPIPHSLLKVFQG